MHSILHHRACILISEGHFIEYVCCWEFVCELSEILFSLCSLCLWEWDEWPSPKGSGSLSFPSLHSLLMWLHSMFDLSLSSLFFIYSSFRYHHRHWLWFILFTSPICFFSYTNLFQVWYFPCIILLYLIISLICLIVSLLILCSHWAPSSPWLTSFSIHVVFYTWGHEFFIVGYLGLVSLCFYYLINLACVTSRVLRPPETMGSDVVFDSPYLDKYLRFGWYLDIFMLLLLGDVSLTFGPNSVVDMDDRDCTFDDGWYDVVWFFWSTTHQVSYWGIFCFDWDL